MSQFLYIGEDTASYQLFFNGVSSSNSVPVVNWTDVKSVLPADAVEKITSAKHIIFSRDIDWKTLKIANLLIEHNIPYSYYADDNYFIKKRIVPSQKVIQFLSCADAFITTTSAMNNYLKKMGSIEQKYIQLDLDVFIPEKSTPKKELSMQALNIGFLGTGKDDLYKDVIQDLSDSLSCIKINIYAPKLLCKLLRKKTIADSITLIEFDFMKNYQEFVHTIKSFNLDFILQPADLSDDNYQFKNLNTLLLPYYCNCLIFFCDSPPYNKIKNQGLNELLTNSNAFSKKIIEISNDNVKRMALTESLFSFVENSFSANNNIKKLQEHVRFRDEDSGQFTKKLEELRFWRIEKIYNKYKRSLYRKFPAVFLAHPHK